MTDDACTSIRNAGNLTDREGPRAAGRSVVDTFLDERGHPLMLFRR